MTRLASPGSFKTAGSRIIQHQHGWPARAPRTHAVQQSIVELAALLMTDFSKLGGCNDPARVPGSAPPQGVPACASATLPSRRNKGPNEAQPGVTCEPALGGSDFGPVITEQVSAGPGACDFGCHASLPRAGLSTQHNPTESHKRRNGIAQQVETSVSDIA